MDKFHGKYRIPSARAPWWDYGQNGFYFITICTKNRECFFGEIAQNKMRLSEIGEIALNYWQQIPQYFPFVQLGAFVIMPDHIHGIIIIDKNIIDATVETGQCPVSNETIAKSRSETGQCPVSTNATNNNSAAKRRFRNQGKETLSSIIGSYKSIVTKSSRKINPFFAWQTRFHDHIIRNQQSYNRITDYIIHNPENWNNDEFII